MTLWLSVLLQHNVGSTARGELQAKSFEGNHPPSVPRKYRSQRSKEMPEKTIRKSRIWRNGLGSPKSPCPALEDGREMTAVWSREERVMAGETPWLGRAGWSWVITEVES